MIRHRPRFLATIQVLSTALMAVSTAHATAIVPTNDGLQWVDRSLFHNISSGPTPPVTPTFPVQQSQQITSGSGPAAWPGNVEGGYMGGSGVAMAAYVDGPAVFSPDLVQPFLADAWAAASARTGQIRAQTHGSVIQRERAVPRASGYSYQYDSVSAFGNAQGSIGNAWTLEFARQSLAGRSPDGTQVNLPLIFGVSLDVDTRFALNPANAAVFLPDPDQPGVARLSFSISFERLLVLDGSPRADTLPDGSPSVVTDTRTFLFDVSHQGRQTLNFEFALLPAYFYPAPPRNFWLPGTGLVRDYQDGLPHSCLDGYSPGIEFGDYCTVKISTEIGLSVSSFHNLAETSVSANWSARINGSTEGVRRVITNADQWGQALDPSLELRPSMLTPVPEPGAWSLLMVGLGGLVWRLRAKG